MDEIHFYTRKNKYTQKMLVNSAFFCFLFVLRINQLQQFFHRYLPAFPLSLIKNICRLSLGSTVFFSFFSDFLSIREKLYSQNFLHFGDSQNFIHVKFSKACYSRK